MSVNVILLLFLNIIFWVHPLNCYFLSTYLSCNSTVSKFDGLQGEVSCPSNGCTFLIVCDCYQAVFHIGSLSFVLYSFTIILGMDFLLCVISGMILFPAFWNLYFLLVLSNYILPLLPSACSLLLGFQLHMLDFLILFSMSLNPSFVFSSSWFLFSIFWQFFGYLPITDSLLIWILTAR